MMSFLQNSPGHIVKNETGPDDPELQETMQEAFSQVSPDDLVAVADELHARHEIYAERFSDPQKLWAPDQEELKRFFREATYANKHAKQASAYFENVAFMPLAGGLLHGQGGPAERIVEFVKKTGDLDRRLSLELATSILHYFQPEKHWLWTRWMWDPGKKTGILPLTAGGTHNLEADNLQEGYVKVGSVSAMSARFAEGTGLISDALIGDPRRSPFAVDVFLASSYAVYLYGITSWRLSREFNNLLPTLPDLMRKLLGLPKQK